MTSCTVNTARRKALFSRTLVLTALLVVAATGSIFFTRSARADAPAKATPEAQALALQIVSQSIGNPALGVSAMQVLWGGGKNDDPPKAKLISSQSERRTSGSPRGRKSTSVKSA